MDIRGGCRFSSLVKQNKKAKICFVIHIAGETKILFYIYFVIVKQNFINGPVITTSLSWPTQHTPPSSSLPKNPISSYSAQTPPRNGNPTEMIVFCLGCCFCKNKQKTSSSSSTTCGARPSTSTTKTRVPWRMPTTVTSKPRCSSP